MTPLIPFLRPLPLFVAWVVCIFVIFLCGFAKADEVHLKDGSLVRGTVSSISDGVAEVKTDFAGVLRIPLDKIGGITTETAQTVTLKAGGVFTGRMQFSDGQQQVLEKGGPATVDFSGLAKARPVPAPGAPKTPAVWKGRVEIGLNGSEGNSDQFDALAGLTVTRVDLRDRLTLSLRGHYQEADAVRTKSEAVGAARFERDLSPRLFAFTRLELEYDEFENLDLRSTLAGGLGYFLIRSPQQDLKIRGGLAYQHEEFGDGSSDDKPLAEAGYDYRLDVRRWLRYNSTFSYFVDPGRVDDWRLTAENSAEFPLSNTIGWKLRLGLRNQYDAEPLPGIEGLDTTYYLSLVYAWN